MAQCNLISFEKTDGVDDYQMQQNLHHPIHYFCQRNVIIITHDYHVTYLVEAKRPAKYVIQHINIIRDRASTETRENKSTPKTLKKD